ncbi:MAG TPA: hypothetical protein PLZ51_24715, partial [Aggregatilineales bacterium]|nr:hypothetical protein [Aggregatilineales bacterium]
DNAFTRYRLNQHMADYFLNQRKPEESWRKLDDLTPQLREMEHRYFIGDYDAVAAIFLEINLDYLLEWGYIELVMGWHTKLEGKIRNPILVQKTIGAWGDAYFDMGNLEMSRQKYTHALSMAREQGDREGESVWLNDLGIIYANLG